MFIYTYITYIYIYIYIYIKNIKKPFADVRVKKHQYYIV